MRDWLAWNARILWTCRVGLLSAGAGVLLFCYAVPAQNLFDDLAFTYGCWSGFTIQRCGPGALFWGFVFLVTLIVWALPIYVGTRLVLDDDSWIVPRAQRRALRQGAKTADAVAADEARVADACNRIRETYRWPIALLPLLLGLFPFVAIALGIVFGTELNKGASQLREGPLTNAQAIWQLVADAVAAALYLGIATYWIIRRKSQASQRQTLSMLAYVSLAVTACFFVVAYVRPTFISDVFPRALLIPSLFGSLVLALSELQRQSARVGVPILLLIAFLAVAVSAANVDFHALRTVPRTQGGDGRLPVREAIDRWLAANGCVDAQSCRRHPLVIAIDGGASRAAFTAATFVGAMLDRMPAVDGEAATPGRRIFAISGVSGGAFGAAVIQAALADAQDSPLPAVAPCRTAERTWFGYAYRSRSVQRFRWQECLQALTSGDYLSPTIIGLAFRDFVAPKGWIEDRAALLEQSFERHYDYTVSNEARLFDAGRHCTEASATGLCRHIAQARHFLDAHTGGWMPLLLLNSTSVRTGRRVIASDLAPTLDAKGTPLFPEAFDLAELMSSPCPSTPARPPLDGRTAFEVGVDAATTGSAIRTNQHGVCAGPPRLDGADLRLSTAALTSARFPLISPAGALQMKQPPFGDRVVDGGYFENSGLTTALEVVGALEEAGLKPILVSIANEPAENDRDAVQAKAPDTLRSQAPNIGAAPSGAAALPQRPSITPLAVYAKNDPSARAFGLLSAPFEALVATRDGHASQSEGLAEQHFFKTRRFFRLHVDQTPRLTPVDEPDPYDQGYCKDIWDHEVSMAKVSMSWWLSALVQADLDAQKCSRTNQTAMNELMRDLCAPRADCRKPVP